MSKEIVKTNQPIGLPEMQAMARSIAASKMFGVATEDQALALMLLCQAEGIHPVMALRRYHIIEGKPAYRADALQGEFEVEGAILWHERNEKECAATFWRDRREVNAKATERAKERYKGTKAGIDVSNLAELGEITIIRTMQDAIDKKVALAWNVEKGEYRMKKNWSQSPRQMLHARCLTEGVRAINPGLVAGIYTEDEIIDMEPGLDQRPPSELLPGPYTEHNVREATANATEGEVVTEGPKVGDKDGVTGGTIVGVQKPETSVPPTSVHPELSSKETITETPDVFSIPKEITEESYGELTVHIGKANGEMLGRKISELHPNVVTWLYEKWRNKLGPSASDQDMRLKSAVEFAYKALKLQPTAAPTEQKDGAGGADTTQKDRSRTEAPSGVMSKDDLVKALQERCEDLVTTEADVCKYLRIDGVLDVQMLSFSDAPVALLEYLYKPEQWKLVKDIVELNLKPKVVDKPVKRRKRVKK